MTLLKMMLEMVSAELPKNINGFRTTHTCELCGFEPKTKNKYREKQDHLVMKHFKEKIDKIFPHCRPYSCPYPECSFTGKDKQALLRHYTGKHGILEKYLREALAEKGISYKPGEGGKRKNSISSDSNGLSKKNPRLSLTPPEPVTKLLENGILNGTSKPVTLPVRPNTEELRKEVEAMMASFQPMEQQVVLQLPNGSPQVVTAIPVIEAKKPVPVVVVTANGTINGVSGPHATMANHIQTTTTVVPVASLPAIVLSAVANVTAANAAANAASSLTIPISSIQTLPTTIKVNHAPVQAVINGNIQLPMSAVNSTPMSHHLTQTVTSSPQQPTSVPLVKTRATIVPSAASLPLPLDVIAANCVNGNHLDVIKSSVPSPVVENEDVMWSASANGPAVVVEAANSVPVTYIESNDSNFSVSSLETIEYDYLYQVTPTNHEVRERQLDFCML